MVTLEEAEYIHQPLDDWSTDELKQICDTCEVPWPCLELQAIRSREEAK